MIPLAYFFIEKSGFDFFVNVFVICGAILCAFSIIQGYVYNSGLSLMSTDVVVYNWKFGSVRLMDQSTMVVLTALIGFGVGLAPAQSRKRRVLFLCSAILAIWCVMFVVQTRAMQFALFASFALLIVLAFKDIRYKFFSIIMITLVFFLLSGSIDQFVSSFDETPQGTAVRLYGWSYYAESVIMHGIFGIGFLAPDSSLYTSIALGGGSFYPSDLGIMKFFGMVGILGVLYFGLFLVWGFSSIQNAKKIEVICTPYCLYCISTSSSLLSRLDSLIT